MGDSLFTRRDLVESNPDLVARFKRASLKGWRYALENSASIAGRISFAFTRAAPLYTSDVFAFNLYQSAKVRELMHYPEVAVGHINPDRWRKTHRVLAGLGLVEKAFDRRAFVFDPDYEAEVRDQRILQWLAGGTLLFASLFVVFMLWNRTLKREVKSRTQDLERSERRLRTIIDAVPSLIFVKNGEGRFLAANKAVADFYGCQVEDIISKKHADIHTVEDEIKQMLEDDRKVIRGEVSSIYSQDALSNCDGDIVWLQTVKVAGADNIFGEPAVVGNAIDVTAMKETEDELRRVIEEAEQASRAKSEFLASMSHELRTPLNAILGFAQMLQYDKTNPLTASQKESVDHIVDGGEHLLALVNEVLDLERIGANEYALDVADIDAGEILKECIQTCAPLGQNRNIQIINAFNEPVGVVLHTDAVRFKQILHNILSNAIKFNVQDGTVTLDGEVTDNGFLRISVTDTGVGIPASDLNQIFNMFYRVGHSGYAAREGVEHEGAGIGLSVTKLLVERLAGHIGVKSEVGVGSTFWVELPLTTNQETLIWADNMRVGVNAIDSDHQILISLLNKSTKFVMDDEAIDEVLLELVDYTRYHFRREEAIMEACGYDDIVAHKKIHTRLTDRVNAIVDEWKRKHDPETLRQLRVLLRNWLVDHIMHVDTTIAPFAKGKNKDIETVLEDVD